GTLGGAVLAAAFLGGLWLTVRRATADGGRALPLALGSLTRIVLVAAGFVLMARFGGPVAMATAFVTFVVVRTAITWRVRVTEGGQA
ncbi:MAG: ATP synthase subunit I, partial [Actinomycetota bacterium]